MRAAGICEAFEGAGQWWMRPCQVPVVFIISVLPVRKQAPGGLGRVQGTELRRWPWAGGLKDKGC